MNGTLAWLFPTEDFEGEFWLRGLRVEASATS